MAERVHPFEGCARSSSGSVVGAGITIAMLSPSAMLNVRGPAQAVSSALNIRYALDHAPEPNTALGAATRVVWLGPNEWLLVHHGAADERDWAHGAVSVTDVSHGRAALRLRGPDVRDALAKGCPIDLDPRVFPSGRCAQTAIGRISVILDHVEPSVFDVYCSRSYAGSFWHWIAQACAEYRYAVAPR